MVALFLCPISPHITSPFGRLHHSLHHCITHAVWPCFASTAELGSHLTKHHITPHWVFSNFARILHSPLLAAVLWLGARQLINLPILPSLPNRPTSTQRSGRPVFCIQTPTPLSRPCIFLSLFWFVDHRLDSQFLVQPPYPDLAILQLRCIASLARSLCSAQLRQPSPVHQNLFFAVSSRTFH